MVIITKIIPDRTLLNITVRRFPVEGKYILDDEIIKNNLLDEEDLVVSVLDHRIYNRPEFDGGYWSMIMVKPVHINCPPFTIYSNRDNIEFQIQYDQYPS
tara:strand:+ start:53 stop:352 length:300 start_codon:yes stop_codon:yes gene_type:complete